MKTIINTETLAIKTGILLMLLYGWGFCEGKRNDIAGRFNLTLCEEPKTFIDASETCKRKGEVLFNPRTVEENIYGCDLDDNKPIWLGIENIAGKWLYSSDNTSVIYKPHDLPGVDGKAVVRRKDDYKKCTKWEASAKTDSYIYLCMKDINPKPYGTTIPTTTPVTTTTTKTTTTRRPRVDVYLGNACFKLLIVLGSVLVFTSTYIVCCCVICSEVNYSVITYFKGSSYTGDTQSNTMTKSSNEIPVWDDESELNEYVNPPNTLTFTRKTTEEQTDEVFSLKSDETTQSSKSNK